MANQIKQIGDHWAINGRPATEFRSGNSWRGMPGNTSPSPGNDYRLAIAWGPRLRLTGSGQWIENVELRVNFDGWRIGNRVRYRDSIQFYNDINFNQITSPGWRVHLQHGNAKFHPDRVGIVDYAYFRITTQRDRAWKMKYNIGLYGSLHQNFWKKVTAR